MHVRPVDVQITRANSTRASVYNLKDWTKEVLHALAVSSKKHTAFDHCVSNAAARLGSDQTAIGGHPTAIRTTQSHALPRPQHDPARVVSRHGLVSGKLTIANLGWDALVLRDLSPPAILCAEVASYHMVTHLSRPERGSIHAQTPQKLCGLL